MFHKRTSPSAAAVASTCQLYGCDSVTCDHTCQCTVGRAPVQYAITAVVKLSWRLGGYVLASSTEASSFCFKSMVETFLVFFRSTCLVMCFHVKYDCSCDT